MEGFQRGLRRMTMTAFTVGLMFVIPNAVQAQTSQPPAASLPWQTASFRTNTSAFDKDWSRVLSDMQQMLRRFAASYPYHGVLKVNADPTNSLWLARVPTYIPPAREPLRVEVGALRATLTPVEFTTGDIAAESRTMEGVLVGAQVEKID